MTIRQTRIFVPPVTPFNDFFWPETLVGAILAPITTVTEWFWFSRYCLPKDKDPGDCDVHSIPDEFGVNQFFQTIGALGYFRSMRFRYKVPDDQEESFEANLRERIVSNGCVISDFRPYIIMDDLGGDRFIVPDSSLHRRIERVDLMVNFLCDVCRLFIHALEGPDIDGKYHLETNKNQNNLGGTLFESGRHLFCNITGVRELVG